MKLEPYTENTSTLEFEKMTISFTQKIRRSGANQVEVPLMWSKRNSNRP